MAVETQSTAPASATRICLVRHGETDWNVERRYQGHLDIGLNAQGHAQAIAAAAGLKGEAFDAFYCSDLLRTRQTASHIAPVLGLPIQFESGLRERHYGLFQGRTAAEVGATDPEAHARYLARDEAFTFGDGESLRDFYARIVATLDRLAAAHPGGSLLAVCHGGVLDCIYRRATGLALSAHREFALPNAAFNRIEISGADWRVDLWADQRHLWDSLDELA